MEAINNAKQYYTENGGRKVDAIAAQLYANIVDSKKISKSTIDESDVVNILRHIERLNSLDMYSRSVEGLRFDEILIPKCFKDFILPRSVVLLNDDRMPDLTERPNIKNGLMEESEIRSFSERLYGMYKKSAEYVTFAECRTDKFINDISFAIALSESEMWMKHTENTWCVPIFVQSIVGRLVGPNYLVEDPDFVMKKYLLNWKVESASTETASE